MKESMNAHDTPQWMKDPEVSNIPREKLEFLMKMYEKSQGKNQKELMTELLPLLQEAKRNQLTFNNQELTTAIRTIKKYASKEELEQIEHLHPSHS